MQTITDNKSIITCFNHEVIQNGNAEIFKKIMDKDFINHSAPEGNPNNADGMWYFFDQILRPAFPDLKVTIHELVADDETVTTRKSIQATHTGNLMGIDPTNKTVVIDIIDIIKIKNGKLSEHWAQNNFTDIIAQLTSN